MSLSTAVALCYGLGFKCHPAERLVMQSNLASAALYVCPFHLSPYHMLSACPIICLSSSSLAPVTCLAPTTVPSQPLYNSHPGFLKFILLQCVSFHCLSTHLHLSWCLTSISFIQTPVSQAGIFPVCVALSLTVSMTSNLCPYRKLRNECYLSVCMSRLGVCPYSTLYRVKTG